MNLIKVVKKDPTARLPERGSKDATGYDLFAHEDVLLTVGDRAAVSTGISLDLTDSPESLDVQVRSRSGLAIKHGIVVLNGIGTIDRDYTGEIKVILINHGEFNYTIRKGDRIAQLVFGAVAPPASFFPVDTINTTGRGASGFGSTGK